MDPHQWAVLRADRGKKDDEDPEEKKGGIVPQKDSEEEITELAVVIKGLRAVAPHHHQPITRSCPQTCSRKSTLKARWLESLPRIKQESV